MKNRNKWWSLVAVLLLFASVGTWYGWSLRANVQCTRWCPFCQSNFGSETVIQPTMASKESSSTISHAQQGKESSETNTQCSRWCPFCRSNSCSEAVTQTMMTSTKPPLSISLGQQDKEKPMSSLPSGCSLASRELQERKAALLRIKAQVLEMKPLENGYSIRFAVNDALLTELFGVIQAERKCCAFLKFTLAIFPNNGPIWLEVTGPGAKEFLQANLP